jgi:ribose transport system ATP-binding protein
MAFTRSLEIRDVSRVFGPIKALSNVSITFKAGSIHAIIGENGAGKSTLMNIISGNMRPSSGVILLDDREVHFHSPLDAQREGIAIAPQEILLAPHLTASENVVLGHHSRSGPVIDWKRTRSRAVSALSDIDPTIDPKRAVGGLTIAQQQLVQIARAISTGAKVLIFDEPTAALTDHESERLFAFLRKFRAAGGASLYISHRLEEIIVLADAIGVLRDGRYVGELDPATTTKNDMIKAMAGREVLQTDLRAAIPYRVTAEIALEVSHLTLANNYRDVSFSLHKGEILAIGGLIGSGRTELAQSIFGVTSPSSGRLALFGRETKFRSPADAIRAGLVYLPEERKRDGIFPLMSIAENIALPNFAQFLTVTGISWASVLTKTEEYIRSIPIKTRTGRQPIAQLSGGNQQKAILARWLMSGCKVLILDEPTRGIDVKAKREIQLLLRQLAEKGLSIIYISSELQELLDVSDRVLLMHEGHVRGIVSTEGATQESLLAVAMR